jgi:hypothetical protein
MLLRLLALWGVADGVWAMIAPRSWSGFWRRQLRGLAQRTTRVRMFAAAEIAIGLYVLARLAR